MNMIAASGASIDPNVEDTAALSARAEITLERACRHLLGRQCVPGYWCAKLEWNQTVTAEYVFLMHMFDRVDEAKQTKCVAEMLAHQLADGGWGTGGDEGGDLSTTVEVYTALKLAGCDPESEALVRARDFILARGGVQAAAVITRVHLAFMGLWDYRELPAMPVWLMMLPDRFPMSIYQMSFWARVCVVPLLVILDRRAVWKPKKAIDIDELVADRDKTDSSRSSIDFLSWTTFFGALDRLLHVFHRIGFVPLRQVSLRRAERWLIDHQNDEGDWAGMSPPIAYSALALQALGYPIDHPVVRRGWRAWERFVVEDPARLFMHVSVSPVWDTAYSAWTLQEAGLPADHPALVTAAEWLLEKQCRQYGDWHIKNPRGKPGGWAFQFYNRYYPDCDDTAVAATALIGIDCGRDNGYRDASIACARDWLLSMQCRNGGWAAFDVDNTQELWNKIPFADHKAMLDEAAPDITGHVLEMFGAMNFSGPAVARAITFLRREQRADGSWYGRWGVNFVYGAGAALCGLRAVGLGVADPAICRGADFLLRVQNKDGGWGESARSYNEDRFVPAPSTPSQTAWAIMGLLAAGKTDSDAVRRGIGWLVSHQDIHGVWKEGVCTGTGFPGRTYLGYTLYRQYFPTQALARYLKQ